MKYTSAEYRKAAQQFRRRATRLKNGARVRIGKIATKLDQEFGGKHWGDSPCACCILRAVACEAIATALDAGKSAAQ